MEGSVCEVCGGITTTERTVEGTGYEVTFTTCARCAETLVRAFAGVTDALRQGHGEKRERWLAKLFERLECNGFTIESRSHPHVSRRSV